MKKLRVSPWIMVLVIGLIAALLPIWPDTSGATTEPISQTAYVMSWVGAMFQAVSGSIIAFLIAKHVSKLDLSAYTDERARAMAGLGLFIFMGLVAVAVCVGI